MSNYYLGFSAFSGIGPKRFARLVAEFGSAKNAWKVETSALEKVIGKNLTAKFVDFQKHFSLEGYEEELYNKHIKYLTLEDEKYPKILKNMGSYPPFVLYYKGDVSVFTKPRAIGIVGTRNISEYGQQVTQLLASQLVNAGFVIVSGLAFGVDAAAHTTTIEEKGKTIAVLGCGVDCCTPRTNQKIYDAIIHSGGLIVSTQPPGEKANKGSFPARNKIIAGLSQGIVVTEGTADSGALITAKWAHEMGRPVFAVPGPITSRLSEATSQLLKNGAVPLTCANDILDTLGIIGVRKTGKPQRVRASDISDNPIEQSILNLLDNESLHFNEIVRRIGKDSKNIGSILSLMELKGLVKSNGEIYSM